MKYLAIIINIILVIFIDMNYVHHNIADGGMWLLLAVWIGGLFIGHVFPDKKIYPARTQTKTNITEEKIKGLENK